MTGSPPVDCCCLVAKSSLILCDPMDCGTPGFPVLHYLPEFAQTHVHWVNDAIQPSHPLSPSLPPALNLSQHQGLFQWVSSLNQVAKVPELHLLHQTWIRDHFNDIMQPWLHLQTLFPNKVQRFQTREGSYFDNFLDDTVSSVAQSCPTLCNPMDCNTPGFPVHHLLLELTQTQAHWVGDAIQPSHPLLSPSPPSFNLSQHQGPFQWVGASHQVAKVLEFQLQHQSFQWIFRTDFL